MDELRYRGAALYLDGHRLRRRWQGRNSGDGRMRAALDSASLKYARGKYQCDNDWARRNDVRA